MNFASVLLAVSTQRAIGWVLGVTVVLGMLLYWFFNWWEGREEVGAELELAANRKPQWDDELMETKRLDMSLTAALAMLVIIAIAMPLYWLGEPGRHAGAIEFREDQFAKSGDRLFEANCAQCHGSVDGDGSIRSFALVDDSGNFIQQVDWLAPSLGGVLDRYSFEEVRYILNFGRQNSPMPAWGAEGGGPLTEQQIENVILYLAREQLSSIELADKVLEGLPEAAEAKAFRDDPDLHVQVRADIAANDGVLQDVALREELDGAVEAILVAAETDQVVLGELLFNNPVASGAYGCARCHSAGASYNADELVADALAAGQVPRVDSVIPGGGGYGPSINGGSTLSQFDTNDEQVAFITIGSQEGQKYGNYGQGVGGGQMPAFGQCVAARDSGERDPIFEHCEGRAGTLTIEQLEAVVAYERGGMN